MRFIEIDLDKPNNEHVETLKKLSLLLNKCYYDEQTGAVGRIIELGMRPDIRNNKLLVYYRTYSDIQYGMCFASDFINGDLRFIKPKESTRIIDGTAEQQRQDIKQFFGDEFRDDMIVDMSTEVLIDSFKKRISYDAPIVEWENCIGVLQEALENIDS